jgi:hypothetical protein
MLSRKSLNLVLRNDLTQAGFTRTRLGRFRVPNSVKPEYYDLYLTRNLSYKTYDIVVNVPGKGRMCLCRYSYTALHLSTIVDHVFNYLGELTVKKIHQFVNPVHKSVEEIVK